MSSSKFHTLDAVQIPRGMVWTDEFDWSPVSQVVRHSTNGALQVHVGMRQAGRLITLQAQNDAGWIRRDVLQTVRAMAAVPGAQYTLTLADGRAFDVIFTGENAIQATPIARPELPPSAHPYVATFRFLEV